jgi:PPM family protein phosphatase
MTANEVPEIMMHGLTHVGNVREDNQDAIRFCSPDEHLTARNGYLYAVADGMGGLQHGGIASALALETFFNTFYKTDGSSIPKKLREGVQMANLGVFQKARQLGVARMGTTLTAVDVIGHSLNIVHVGDSRAYLVRHDKASCLTNDHTRVGEMVRMKLLSPDKVRAHNQRSVLEKCLGVELFVQPDISHVRVQNGDVIILCTDGVWSVIEDAEFAGIVAEEKDAESVSQRIIDLAMSRKSDDNLSVVALFLRRLVPSQHHDEGSRWNRVMQRLRNGRGGS